MTKLFQRAPRACTMAATSAAGFSQKRATRRVSVVNGAPGSIQSYSASGRLGGDAEHGHHVWMRRHRAQRDVDMSHERAVVGDPVIGGQHEDHGAGIRPGEAEETVEQSGPRAPVLRLDHHTRRALAGEE
jgi:hypothetical protein